jgi:hypothetical protein
MMQKELPPSSDPDPSVESYKSEMAKVRRETEVPLAVVRRVTKSCQEVRELIAGLTERVRTLHGIEKHDDAAEVTAEAS